MKKNVMKNIKLMFLGLMAIINFSFTQAMNINVDKEHEQEPLRLSAKDLPEDLVSILLKKEIKAIASTYDHVAAAESYRSLLATTAFNQEKAYKQLKDKFDEYFLVRLAKYKTKNIVLRGHIISDVCKNFMDLMRMKTLKQNDGLRWMLVEKFAASLYEVILNIELKRFRENKHNILAKMIANFFNPINSIIDSKDIVPEEIIAKLPQELWSNIIFKILNINNNRITASANDNIGDFISLTSTCKHLYLLKNKILRYISNLVVKTLIFNIALKAIRANNVDALYVLLKMDKFDINAKDATGENLLLFAVLQKNERIVWLLLEGGIIDINAIKNDDNGRNALMRAISLGQENIAELLIQKGINIHYVDKLDYDALIWAIDCQCPIIAKLLIQKGIDINRRHINGITALGYALQKGQEIVALEILTRKDISIDVKSSALIDAIRFRQIKVAKLLIELGVDINYAEASLGITPLIAAIIDMNEELVELILKQPGIDLDYRSKNGNNALMWAVSWKRKNIIKLLLAKGSA